jgi:hypothetical protein
MSLTHLDVREAIAFTALQADPDNLNAYPYMNPFPTAPAVCVGVEVVDYLGAFGGGMTANEWRLWVLLNPGSDWIEAQRQADEYLDYTGERSLYAAFEADGAYYRTRGFSDIRLERFARLPSDIQGPNLLDWGGTVYWGVPITVRVRYGTT